jgi:hypothetical protein
MADLEYLLDDEEHEEVEEVEGEEVEDAFGCEEMDEMAEEEEEEQEGEYHRVAQVKSKFMKNMPFYWIHVNMFNKKTSDVTRIQYILTM